MRTFGFRKKKEGKPPKEALKTSTELETFCANKEIYEALYETVLLDPQKNPVSMEEAVKRAKEFEKAGDKSVAARWYAMAGAMAVYKGDVEKVIQFFTKCQELSGKSYLILQIPEKAVNKAQEYYKKYLKEEEKK